MSKALQIIQEDKKLVVKHVSKTEDLNLRSLFLIVLILSFGIIAAISFWGLPAIIPMIGIGIILGTFPSTLPSILTITNRLHIEVDKEGVIIESAKKATFFTDTEKYITPTQKIKRVFLAMNGDHYTIWIEGYDGRKKSLLGPDKGFFIEKKKEAEELMEKIIVFLQIQNQHRPTLRKVKKIALNTPRRKIKREQDLSKLAVKDLKKGALLDYNNETWELIEEIQYDWKQGNTDTLYQLTDTKNTTMLLLVHQDIAIFSIWLEERLSYYELASHKLDKIVDEAPLKLKYKEKTFFKDQIQSGYEFVSTQKESAKVKQWRYFSEDKKYSLRILNHEEVDDDVFVLSGKEVQEYEFSNILLRKQ